MTQITDLEMSKNIFVNLVCLQFISVKFLYTHGVSYVYLAMGCFEVDGGSSSSHGQTDTETAAFSLAPTSSHGQTAHAGPGNTPGSKVSGINFVVSLSIRPANRTKKI